MQSIFGQEEPDNKVDNMAGLGKKGVDTDGSTVLVEPPPPVVG